MIVSCVIPTHRRPVFLSDALAGVKSQSLRPHEVIVVDDSADDDVRQTVEKAALDSSLAFRYLINESGTGAGSSRNFGAVTATGDVLAFLDDDDYWEPSYLENALTLMRRTGVAAAVSWISTLIDGREGPQTRPPSGLTAKDVIAVNPGVTGSNLVISRAAFQRVGGYDESLWVSNDKDFLIRFLDAGLDYQVVAQPLVVKRAHSEERLTTVNENRLRGLRAFLAKYDHRLSKRDRRILLAKIAWVSAKTAANPFAKVAHRARWVALEGPLRIIAARKRERVRT